MVVEESISFVVQGPIGLHGENSTQNVLKSIRKYFPKSEIILSTWVGEAVAGLEFDILVQSDLPDALIIFTGKQLNINRLLVSTKKGIEASTKQFVAKTRTDVLFTDSSILKKFDLNNNSTVFKNFVYTIELFTRDAYLSSTHSFYDGFLHHPSDIFLFGTKHDLLELFSCKLAKIEVIFNRRGKSSLTPEQYIWMSLLKKNKKIRTFRKSLASTNLKCCYYSEKLLFENYKIFKPENLGLKLATHLKNGWLPNTVVTEELQNKINLKSDFQKKIFYFQRAFFYCWIRNFFFKKVLKIKYQ